MCVWIGNPSVLLLMKVKVANDCVLRCACIQLANRLTIDINFNIVFYGFALPPPSSSLVVAGRWLLLLLLLPPRLCRCLHFDVFVCVVCAVYHYIERIERDFCFIVHFGAIFYFTASKLIDDFVVFIVFDHLSFSMPTNDRSAFGADLCGWVECKMDIRRLIRL